MADRGQPGSTSRAELERALVQKASQDPKFKQQLLANPRDAVKAVFGLELPPDVELQVLQETPARFYVVLPPDPDELSDSALGAVAGGFAAPTSMKFLKIDAISTEIKLDTVFHK